MLVLYSRWLHLWGNQWLPYSMVFRCKTTIDCQIDLSLMILTGSKLIIRHLNDAMEPLWHR